MNEQIAVIVPVFNTEKYLEQCVDSILAQEYKNLDILLIDDGSTDRSGIICDTFSEKYERVKTFHTKNGGKLNARCVGLENTDAEYILFVDSDDWIRSDMCGKLYEAMKEKKVDVVASGIIRAYPDGHCQYRYNALLQGAYWGKDYEDTVIPHMLCNGFFFQCGIDPSLAIKLFKKSFLYPQIKKAADYGFYYGEDTVVTYPVLLNSRSIYLMDECFYFHRQYDNRVAFYTQRPDYEIKLKELYGYLKSVFMKHKKSRILMRQLDYYYAYSMYIKYAESVKAVADNVPKHTAKDYLFPFQRIPKGSRVVLYGAGDVGTVYYRQLLKSEYCSELIWMDKAYRSLQKQSFPVINPDIRTEADYYVLAVADRRTADEIRKQLREKGIDESKMIWEDPLLHLW